MLPQEIAPQNNRPKYIFFYLGQENSLAKQMEGHQKMGMEFDFTLGHYVEQCTKLGIFIDFDGTLSPLARTPELAFIPPETKKVSNFSTIHNGAIKAKSSLDAKFYRRISS